MNLRSLSIVYLIVLLGGCSKEEVIPGIVNELVFECTGGNAESFLEAYMGEEKFCYYDGVDQYEMEISMTSAFITDGPTTSTNIDTGEVDNFRVWGNLGFNPKVIQYNDPVPFPHLKHYLVVRTPASPVQIPLSQLIRNSLTQVGDLPLSSDAIDETQGFNICFRFNDLDEGASRIFLASGGNQDGSYLRLTELGIYDQGTTYSVTFEFSCNLYYYGDPDKFYARINNGVMKLYFTI